MTDAAPTPQLLAQHEALIRDSAISPSVALDRGYRTVASKAELKRLGFSDAQRRVPGLLNPLHNTRGEIANYQFRSDEPRFKDGRAVKYETPAGSVVVLDVPPIVHRSGELRRGDKPLFITEGVRKADSGASAGLTIIGLIGVWNWRGTNEVGGKTALPDWEDIDLKGRKVYIVFDSDVMEKLSVAKALERLKAFLEGRGSKVELIYLPDGPGGKKLGLDDYLALGHSVQDLMALATPELRSIAPSPPSDVPSRYFVADGHTYMSKATKDGDVPCLLANFAAQIVGDVVVDDGLESRREFELEVQFGSNTQTITISPSAFESMTWPSAKLGGAAVVQAGLGTKDHLRVAIQSRNLQPRTLIAYVHTGWREIGEHGWCFIHAGGALGAAGPVPGVEVRLPAIFDAFVLPPPPEPAEEVEALRAVIRLLDIGPDSVSIPIVSAVFRAPLGDCLLSAFLEGLTGTFKTEFAAIAQSFFAPGITVAQLPCAWSSTANSIEATAFVAKDMLLVVDDFIPKGTANDVARKHADADRVLRAQGNRSGRGRLNGDFSVRATKPPRGLILSTGEELPSGHSLVARMWVIELKDGDITSEKLTVAQRDSAAGLYAKAMAGFLRRFAANFPQRKSAFEQRLLALREQGVAGGSHARVPANAANLHAAFEEFLAYAVEAGAATESEAGALLNRALSVWKQTGDSQAQHQRATDQVNLFLESIAAAVGSGAAHVADIEGKTPLSDPIRFGWRAATSASPASSWEPQGDRIGWVEGDDLFINLPAAFRVASRLGDNGDRLTITQKTLLKRIADRGMCRSQDSQRGRHTIRRQIQGARRAVLHLGASLVLDGSQQAQSPHDAGGTVPIAGIGAAPLGRCIGYPSDSVPALRPNREAANGQESGAGPAGTVGPVSEPGDGPGSEPERATLAASALAHGVRGPAIAQAQFGRQARRDAIIDPSPCTEHPQTGSWRLSESRSWTCGGCRPCPPDLEGVVVADAAAEDAP